MHRAFEYFRGLQEAVAVEDVSLSGAWTGKPQRRYASSEQFGTGEGPFLETVDWRWEGTFEALSPVAGLALLAVDTRLYWVKSHPPTSRPEVSISAAGWSVAPSSVSVTGSFHGAFLPSAPVSLGDAPPTSCVIGSLRASTGTAHVVAQIERVAFAVLLLPASAIQVGRNRLWHLHERIASPLRPDLHRLLTRGRSGCIEPASA